jgi:hypothetical protein
MSKFQSKLVSQAIQTRLHIVYMYSKYSCGSINKSRPKLEQPYSFVCFFLLFNSVPFSLAPTETYAAQ